ncbi:hypothetical protein ACIOGX_33690 [Streptomyces sp. NPDC088147]|uniref:hypothetical protein n=1 Tax=unclassified Streptomyces TaxID=2593676 RepID=UPI00381A6B89
MGTRIATQVLDTTRAYPWRMRAADYRGRSRPQRIRSATRACHRSAVGPRVGRGHG